MHMLILFCYFISIFATPQDSTKEKEKLQKQLEGLQQKYKNVLAKYTIEELRFKTEEYKLHKVEREYEKIKMEMEYLPIKHNVEETTLIPKSTKILTSNKDYNNEYDILLKNLKIIITKKGGRSSSYSTYSKIYTKEKRKLKSLETRMKKLSSKLVQMNETA